MWTEQRPAVSESKFWGLFGGGKKKKRPEPESEVPEVIEISGKEPLAEPAAPEASSRIPETEMGRVMTDKDMVELYYRYYRETEARAVTTDRFIERSREQYNADFLARELIQNFVDHNRDHRGTLDGVIFEETPLEPAADMPNGGVRFVIRGDWPFIDNTGLISAHSEKSDETHSAGGNGIGLKQAAIRFMRDFGVRKFEVQGTGWIVNYELARADEINAELEASTAAHNASPAVTARHDWLMARIDKTSEPAQSCAYVIETDDPELIRVLRDMQSLGVSSKNKYLQNPDFAGKHGVIKWLPPRLNEAGRPVETERGRLFINGQVMNYKEKGKGGENYWQGPEHVTLSLPDINYDMSIDRPPVRNSDLSTRYLDKLINSMSLAELFDQIRRSELIWSTVKDALFSDQPACFVVLEKIIRRLRWYHQQEAIALFKQTFGHKKYLCIDKYGINDQQLRDLEKHGYILCPRYFADIGMDKASEKLSNVEVALTEKPNAHSALTARREQAEKYGLQVYYHEIGDQALPTKEFLTQARAVLAEHGLEVVEMGQDESGNYTWQLNLRADIPAELLANPLPRPKKGNQPQELLAYIRGVIFQGLNSQLFLEAGMSQGEYVTTFVLQPDEAEGGNVLVARNLEAKSDQKLFVRVKVAGISAGDFRDVFSASKAVAGGKKEIQALADKPAGGDGGKTAAVHARDKGTTSGSDTGVKKEQAAKSDGGGEGELAEKLRDIPVEHPPEPKIQPTGEIKEVKKTMTAESAKRLADLSPRISGLREAVEKLEEHAAAGSTAESSKTSVDERIKAYVAWRASGSFYGQAADQAQYLSGRHLLEIMVDYASVGIAARAEVEDDQGKSDEVKRAEREVSDLKSRLKDVVNSLSPEHKVEEDFELVQEPSPEQLAKLGLLRAFTHLVGDNLAIPNDLFIFRGSGTQGINIGTKAIGLHEALLREPLERVMNVFLHEVAHNEVMNHESEFIAMLQALFFQKDKVMHKLAGKSVSGEKLSDQEAVIVDIIGAWKKMGQKK